MKLFLMTLMTLFLLFGCSDNSSLKTNAKNETWTNLVDLENAFSEAENNFFKDYYFIDFRSEIAYKTMFVAGFKRVSRQQFDTYFKDIKKHAMIVLFSGNSETLSEAASYLDALGFYNLKVVDVTEQKLFSYFPDRLMSIDDNGDTCPIDPNPGC